MLFAVHPVHVEAVTGVVGGAECFWCAQTGLLMFLVFRGRILENVIPILYWYSPASSTHHLCHKQDELSATGCSVSAVFLLVSFMAGVQSMALSLVVMDTGALIM